MEGRSPTASNQLVSYLLALHSLHNAEYGTQDTFTLYHLLQEEAGKSPNAGIGPALPALGHALAGSVATASAKVLLYPLDICVTRLQVQHQLRGKGEAESAAKDAIARVLANPDVQSVGESLRTGALKVSRYGSG